MHLPNDWPVSLARVPVPPNLESKLRYQSVARAPVPDPGRRAPVVALPPPVIKPEEAEEKAEFQRAVAKEEVAVVRALELFAEEEKLWWPALELTIKQSVEVSP